MKVLSGIDNIDKSARLFEGRRIGLITNATGVDRLLRSTVDILHERFGLTRLFAPEHGIRSDIEAGVKVDSYTDAKTGLPVISLYGSHKKPTEDDFAGLDLIAFDIQDAGSRFYTYLYTMAYAMQSAKEYGKRFVVFDRPNPINGVSCEGNILNPACKSFIGLYAIVQRYGLTIGEAARMFNEEFGIGCDLEVVRLEGWDRGMYYERTGLPWILPSPNLPSVDACVLYNGTCVFEGTNISEGRGTTKPFEFIGAPWLDAELLAREMNGMGLEGVLFRPVYFTPTFSKHKDVQCRGVQAHVTDREVFKAVKTGITLLHVIREQSGGEFEFTKPYTENGKHMIDYNTGNSVIREGKYSLSALLDGYDEQAREFLKVKERYHLY